MVQRESVSVETLRAIADAFNAHDLDAIMEFFADDRSLDMPRGQEPQETEIAKSRGNLEAMSRVVLPSIVVVIAALPVAFRARFREAGIGLDVMQTGAAARTYNILLAENRKVGAALIAVP